MRLAAAARRFDNLVCADAYTPATSFLGQFDLYDDSRRDGATVERRILSTAPSVTIPARRTLVVDGRHWLVGDPNPDYYKGEAIRIKYAIHVCDALATIKSIQQTLQNAAGTTAYSALMYVKGAKEIEVSSGVFDVFNMFFGSAETIAEKSMVSLNNRWYLVRTVFKSAAGFLTAVVDELPEPVVENVSFSVSTYNPLTDTTTVTPSSITAVRVRWQSAFEYLSAASEKYERGDLQVMVLKTVTPKAQDVITLSDGTWRVISVLDEGTYWSLHLRLA